MRALVTGASGFIGSTLIEELGTIGFDVRALLRSSSSLANLEGLSYRRVEGDLSDEESLRRAVRAVDYVFHLAGVTAARDRAGYFEHNAEGTQRLAAAVAKEHSGLSRFVYVSSLAAAGPAESVIPRTETEIDRPVSAYGESKLRAEVELLRYQDKFPITVVRPPIVYGPKDKGVFQIIKTVARNFMPVLRGATPDGNKYYSAIHVKDLCRGIVQAALAPAVKNPSGEIFFLSGDGIHTYRELLRTIADQLECNPVTVTVPRFAIRIAAAGLTVAGAITKRTFPLNLDKLNELLPDYWICSNEKAKHMLGFSPEFDLSSGMSNAIEWYRRQKWI